MFARSGCWSDSCSSIGGLGLMMLAAELTPWTSKFALKAESPELKTTSSATSWTESFTSLAESPKCRASSVFCLSGSSLNSAWANAASYHSSLQRYVKLVNGEVRDVLTGHVWHVLKLFLPELWDGDGLLLLVDSVGGHSLLISMSQDTLQIVWL